MFMEPFICTWEGKEVIYGSYFDTENQSGLFVEAGNILRGRETAGHLNTVWTRPRRFKVLRSDQFRNG